jgi:hypothetical protein
MENFNPARSDIHILLTTWRLISLRHRVQTGSKAHPAFFPMDTGGSFLGGGGGAKRPGRDADHSPPSSAFMA